MKRTHVLCVLAASVTCALLLLPSALSPGAARGRNASLDAQAQAQAERFFRGMYAKCEGFYYYKYNERDSVMYQCKYPPSVYVDGKTNQPRRLSEADRLNGVDPLPVAWEGRAVINLGLCRSQTYRGEPGFAAWGRWLDQNNDAVRFTNSKGRWEFHNQPTGREAYTVKVVVPLTCNDVPSEARRAPIKLPYWDGRNYDGNFLRIPANYGEWFSLGRGPMRIRLPSPYSQIFIDGTNNPRTPLGEADYQGGRDTVPDALAPSLRLGAIILKVGRDGAPYQPFRPRDPNSYLDGNQINSDDEVFIAINDSHFGDNRGEHVVVVRGAAPLPTSGSANNIALGRPVSVSTNGANDASDIGERCTNPAEITDGVLNKNSRDCADDGVAGWQNNDYNQLLEVSVTIDLGGHYNISKIRYNPGNVQRAENWTADLMTTPFGPARPVVGAPGRGAWTEQDGSLDASSVTITFQKTRTAWTGDWLYVGEIEIIGQPDSSRRPTLKRRAPAKSP